MHPLFYKLVYFPELLLALSGSSDALHYNYVSLIGLFLSSIALSLSLSLSLFVTDLGHGSLLPGASLTRRLLSVLCLSISLLSPLYDY